MDTFHELIGDPLYWGLILIFLGPFTAALIYRRWSVRRPKRGVPVSRLVPNDDVIQANRDYARRFDLQGLPAKPARRLAVVTCMDARLPVERLLGLKVGEAHVIRNAGGVVTDDTLRSLLVSHYLLGTEAFLLIGHTGCGMMTFTDEEMTSRLRRLTGEPADVAFHAFRDLHDNVRRQVEKVRAHPWMPKTVPVRGLVYDVKTGLLQEVASAQKQ